VFRGGPTFHLLVDVKSDATNTYQALRVALTPYQDVLTRFEAHRTTTNSLTVVISGNRARDLMMAEPRRWMAYDGRLSDLDGAFGPELIPWISDNWTTLFPERKSGARAAGPLTAAERTTLRVLVSRAHAQGRWLRLWGAPDNAEGWKDFTEAGVDLINTDDLAGLSVFLRAGKPAR
jgi:hypothetical protein